MVQMGVGYQGQSLSSFSVHGCFLRKTLVSIEELVLKSQP